MKYLSMILLSEIVSIPQKLPEFITPDNNNVLHQLFKTLGCDLDYVPAHKYEAFIMGLQFLAALWFISMFVRFLYKTTLNFLTGGRL